MKIVSRLLPQQIRHRLRHLLDSVYSTPLPDKETIGVTSQWTIVTRGLGPDSVVYSGGVGEDITFEQELIRRFGVRIHIFDPSPVAVQTIANAKDDHLSFKPIGLCGWAERSFAIGGGVGDRAWLKAGGNDVEGACTHLPREMKINGHDSIDLLKIDIEGFEYEVLESCFNARIPIKQICVEFHDFFPHIPKAKTSNMIRLMKSYGFDLIHRNRHAHTF